MKNRKNMLFLIEGMSRKKENHSLREENIELLCLVYVIKG